MNTRHRILILGLALGLASACRAASGSVPVAEVLTLDVTRSQDATPFRPPLKVVDDESDGFLDLMPADVRETLKVVLRSGEVLFYTVHVDVAAVRDDLFEGEISVLLENYDPFLPYVGKFYRMRRLPGSVRIYTRHTGFRAVAIESASARPGVSFSLVARLDGRLLDWSSRTNVPYVRAIANPLHALIHRFPEEVQDECRSSLHSGEIILLSTMEIVTIRDDLYPHEVSIILGGSIVYDEELVPRGLIYRMPRTEGQVIEYFRGDIVHGPGSHTPVPRTDAEANSDPH